MDKQSVMEELNHLAECQEHHDMVWNQDMVERQDFLLRVLHELEVEEKADLEPVE